MTSNPFPESDQKSYLRIIHLKHLAQYKESIGRDLVYLGLPSGEMLDVKVWKHVLGHITAIERDYDIALNMYRNAQLLGVRDKTVIIEKDLSEAMELLSMEDKTANLTIMQLSAAEQEKIRFIRGLKHDIVNLDLCGGFLYPKQDGTSENVQILDNLIQFQAKSRHPFYLILTFNLRDTGKDDYLSFINESLDLLERETSIQADEVRRFYAATQNVKGQPVNLRRLRFCVPAYLHKSSFQYYQVKTIGSWYYKTFYHVALFFTPRQGGRSLGMPWPPIDEFKELLRTPMTHVKANEHEIILEDLPAPNL